MKHHLFNLFFAMALSSGTAIAQTEANYQSTPEDVAKVNALAAKLVGELASKCPIKPVGDAAAHKACREALFSGESVFRNSLKRFILWGRPLGGDINATLKDFRATQFGNDVYTGTYAPMWMWDGKYEVEYVVKDRVYRITAGAGFRNELDYGQYPYPFWHEAKKWTDYEDANTMAIWIDPKVMKISQLTFYKRADKPAVAQSTRRHMPTFDGKWMWVDEKGQQQPAPTLFVGLYSDKNPNMAKLDASYRKLALTMRDAECDSCHVPSNPDKAKRLVLLQTPLHAASEIERLLKDVRQDRMPLDDSGIEKPLKADMKKRLLADAEAFEAVIKAARAWEASNAAKAPAPRKASTTKTSALQVPLK
jgi:hypothetical protein